MCTLGDEEITMEVSVAELRRRTKEVLAAADQDGAVTITHRGKPRALVVPVTKKKRGRRSIRDYPAYGILKEREDMKDPVAWVRNLRRSRHDALR
jgi:prevent-host-death family protein